MIATGQPIDEIEDELRAVGRHFGHPDVQVGAGPTGLYLALASGEPATFASVAGGLRLDQAADVRLIRHLVATDQLGVEPAVQRLRELPGKPPRYPRWLADLGFIGIAVGICLDPAAGAAQRGGGGARRGDRGRAVPARAAAPLAAAAAADGGRVRGVLPGVRGRRRRAAGGRAAHRAAAAGGAAARRADGDRAVRAGRRGHGGRVGAAAVRHGPAAAVRAGHRGRGGAAAAPRRSCWATCGWPGWAGGRRRSG